MRRGAGANAGRRFIARARARGRAAPLIPGGLPGQADQL